MQEERHIKEKKTLKEENKEVKNNTRIQKVSFCMHTAYSAVSSGPFICGVDYHRIM